MSKIVLASKQTEWKGLDRISVIVHQMGNIWREMTKDDFGLDGEIEVVTPKANGDGFETAGGIVKVQSKAGESYVRYDTDASFSSPVDQNDLEYWQKCTFPVLYIVYHPKDDKLYFKEVKAYIRDTPGVFGKPHHIKFDKAKDEFTASSKAAVAQHAKVSPPRISFDQKERLFTNLLPIRKLPDTLYYATTRRKSRQRIRDEIEGYLPPFCIVDGKLYSLSDLANEECALKEFCNQSKGATLLPEPTRVLIDGAVRVHDDGRIEGMTRAARRLIRLLGLDGREETEARLLWIGIIALAQQSDRALYQRLMGFPDELPDLKRLRPPGGNTRPEGVAACFHAQRRAGTLPATY